MMTHPKSETRSPKPSLLLKADPALRSRPARCRRHGSWFIGHSQWLLLAGALLALWPLGSGICHAAPLGSAFTYQGRLNDGGVPATGAYDLQFSLHDAATGGAVVAGPVEHANISVSNGLFAVQLDFGSGPFSGQQLWLSIGVRTAGGPVAFDTLAPRQLLTAAPHALYARTAPATNLSGTVPDLNLPANLARTNHIHFGQDWLGGGAAGLRVFNGADGANVGLLGSALGIGSRGVQGQNNGGGAGVMGQSPDGPGVIGQSSTGHLFLGRHGLGEERFWVDAGGMVRAKGGFQGDGSGLSNVTAAAVAPGALEGVWMLGGNAIAGEESFLGTTNWMPLNLRVNNHRALRLEYSARFDGFSYDWGISVYGGYWENTMSGGVIGGTISGGGYLHYDLFGSMVPHINQVTDNFGTVAGGYDNSAGLSGTVSGGHHNTAGSEGTVSGGHHNFANSQGTVPGGYYNEAIGVGSFAAGTYAHATHAHSFVWCDGMYDQYSSNDFSFVVGARGGSRFILGDEGLWAQTGKGVSLDAQDSPMITRGWDPFNGGAGNKSGLGRWGLFMEPTQLVLGIPAEDAGSRTFAVGKYSTDGSYQPLITVAQNGNLTCQSLTILGGADLAEPFAMTEQNVLPGSVVVIDKANPGRLKLSRAAYDQKVAGVVSGANGIKAGISMVQEDALEAGRNVALSGRVYVLADAQFGAIEPGDLLTTSDTPGHARKVTDPARAQGAILGKAMTVLSEGRGMVLVLVTLQ